MFESVRAEDDVESFVSQIPNPRDYLQAIIDCYSTSRRIDLHSYLVARLQHSEQMPCAATKV